MQGLPTAAVLGHRSLRGLPTAAVLGHRNLQDSSTAAVLGHRKLQGLHIEAVNRLSLSLSSSSVQEAISMAHYLFMHLLILIGMVRDQDVAVAGYIAVGSMSLKD